MNHHDAPSDEISPLHRKLIRALVTENWGDEELEKALDVLRKLSRNRRAASGTGEHLTVRRGKDRADKIVVKDGKKVKSTGQDAVEGQEVEANVFALFDLASYRRDVLDKTKAEVDPLSYEINFILRSYVDSQKPGAKVPDRRRKIRTWYGVKNYAQHLTDSFGGWVLRDIDVDTGRYYYRDRLEKPLYRGERKNANEPKDSPVYKELLLLRKAIKWFVGKRKLAKTPSAFDMPYFVKFERDFFTYSELIQLFWACLGFSAEEDGWKRTAHIPPATSEWLIRFFMLYLLTGTRYVANALLFWGLNDAVGCIDVDNGVIWRYGRQQVMSRSKPRRRSDMNPFMVGMVRKWEARDRKLAEEKGIPYGLVIHDEYGEPPRNFVKTITETLKRSGIGKTSHLVKHAGVTLLAALGYPIVEISELFGNSEQSLRSTYLHINWDRIERRRAERIPLKRFSDLAKGSPPTMPRATVDALVVKLKNRGRLRS